ncbi:fluoride efflux transporter CrcB [Paracoccus sediminis]|uniref:Fluoride-specific ion channel FluC n=1 Tax=Paracoccus sediminis TaxID=1214787 RepID=A0A238UNZ5_9RHOB|nr:CrcB family protein [Paracoccus sediminis]TBN52985.1 fluoride efflux transporter CrcB [Paracoccus sediminis]SNR23836.1 CrcB protein [Paracoccus sediminis]
MMNPFLQVAVGGAIGSVARFGLYRAIPVQGFPLATLLVNVLGSLVMGLLAALLAQRGGDWAPLLLTGILGGFTTFSAFSLDSLTLWERGQGTAMALYVAASVLLSLGAVFAGLTAGRGLFA